MSEQVLSSYAKQVLARVRAVLADFECPWPISTLEHDLLIVLRDHVGQHNAISRAQLVELLSAHDREVREAVSQLRVNFGVAIGSSSTPGASGYFLISNDEEAKAASLAFLKLALANFRVVKAMRGKHTTVELLGQMSIDLNLTEEAAHG